MTLDPKTRRATPVDIERVCEIRQHPLVVPHQFPGKNIENVLGDIILGVRADSPQLQIDVVEMSSGVVGYILHCHTDAGDVRLAQCGWSLHPDFWGGGIMTSALRGFFTDLIGREKHTHIVADCFSSNLRCINLLDRLGFKRWPYPLTERIGSAFRNRSLKWQQRYGIIAEEWPDAAG